MRPDGEAITTFYARRFCVDVAATALPCGIARGDIVVATMRFLDDHITAVLPALSAAVRMRAMTGRCRQRSVK